MRSNIKAATHLGGTGACITTLLAWLFGPIADPLIKHPAEQLDMWVQTWNGLDARDRRETRHTWAAAVGKLLKGKSLNKSRGPIEGTIICLVLLGWKPAAPDYWVISQEQWVRLDANGYTRFQINACAFETGQTNAWSSVDTSVAILAQV